MKNILLVCSTKLEIEPFLNLINNKKVSDNKYIINKNKITILISGIGITAITYSLTKQILINSYDLIINIGISGAFDKNIKIGEVLNINKDRFGDLGIENKNGFDTLFESGFINNNDFPFTNGELLNDFSEPLRLKKATAITVNKTSGTESSIKILVSKFHAQTESMEGAAFFYVCMMEKTRCLQIRAISNYVEEKNKSLWNIPLSVKNLATELKIFLEY